VIPGGGKQLGGLVLSGVWEALPFALCEISASPLWLPQFSPL
jgi:hypothetical protein